MEQFDAATALSRMWKTPHILARDSDEVSRKLDPYDSEEWQQRRDKYGPALPGSEINKSRFLVVDRKK
jgi:hypothetical protein